MHSFWAFLAWALGFYYFWAYILFYFDAYLLLASQGLCVEGGGECKKAGLYVCVCGSVYALCLRYATFMTSTVAQQSQSETERERESES